MTKILVMGPDLPAPVMEHARAAGATILSTAVVLPPTELTAMIKHEQPDAIIVRLGGLSRQAIDASGRLRIVAKHGVGYDSIDVSAATSRGIPVTITEGANSQSVAEHALALMLSVARRIPWLDGRVRAGYWDKTMTSGIELAGKTLGLVGAGAIGKTFAHLVTPLRMRTLAYDPFLSDDVTTTGLELVSSVDELIQRSDVISLHCPLTPLNKGLMGSHQFAQMRPDGIFINTARGELVDMEALTAALESRAIFGAGLDTFTIEPAPRQSPLWALSNLVVTPHIGGTTREAALRVGMTAVNQALDWLGSGRIAEGRIVNPDFERAVGVGR